jgi:hypothetical protein
MANINTIYFKRIDCKTAEAIFGDTIEIIYNGRQIWQGTVNTNGSIALPNRRYRIPQGAGGEIMINQWYFGQTKETVFIERVLQTDDPEEDFVYSVDAYFDSDPNGAYDLHVQRTLESWPPIRSR